MVLNHQIGVRFPVPLPNEAPLADAPARPTWRELLWVTATFAALTVALTYPQIRVIRSHTAPHYDTLFSVWRLAWIAHQLPRDPRHLLDANIFYPEARTFTYSDAVPLPAAIAAPLIWLGLPPVSVHNILVLVSFVGCGVAMYVLVRELTASPLAAMFSGVVFAFQPYRFAHYAQLETLWGWPIPLAFWALHRVFDTRKLRDGLWLGVMVAVQLWSCMYYGVFLATALVVLVITLLVGQSRQRLAPLIKPGLVAVLTCGALTFPYAALYAENTRSLGPRTEKDLSRWSPTLRNYVATPSANWIYGRLTPGVDQLEGVLFPGALAVLAALVGVTTSADRRRFAYTALLIVAFDLSLGVNGRLYRLLYQTLWVYRGFRVPARMFVIVSAALAVLGGLGVLRLLAPISGLLRRRAVGLALIVLVLLESASMPLGLRAVPQALLPMYAWLKKQPQAVVMEWPMASRQALGLTHDPLYMYYATFHWQWLVNGYSGFYPPSYIRFLEGVSAFPSPDATTFLRSRAVQFIILHGEFEPRYLELRWALTDNPAYELVFTMPAENGEAALYRMR